MRSSRQEKPSCLLDGYSLALEVPKAVSTKRVGLKRDTEETSVFFFSFSSIVSGVLLENMSLSSAAVSLFSFRKGTVTVVLKEDEAQKGEQMV